MKEILVASGNKGKIREIAALLAGLCERVLSTADFPGLPEVEEDGADFAANALKKAASASRFAGIPVIADDSGLVVEALGGKPGVLSARFAGSDATDADNNAKLLRELSGVPPLQRSATFHCVIALCWPDGTCHTFDGELRGLILDAPRGDGGFGYDPLFMVREYGLTLAELPLEVKNTISHRGRALAKMKDFLQHG